jgi:hypothetical protein
MARRIALFDPARRLGRDLGSVAAAAGVELVEVGKPAELATLEVDAILIAPAVAAELGPAPADGAPRWIVGDPSNAGRLAGAAASAQAVGVLLAPVSEAGLAVAITAELASRATALLRSRGLIAASVMDANPATLGALAEAFSATDCIVWWKEGETMTPISARDVVDPSYR